MRQAPFIFVIGPPKVGKTIGAFEAFRDALAIQSSANVTFGYRKLCKTNADLKPPKKIKLIELRTTSIPSKQEAHTWDYVIKPTEGDIPQRAELEGTLKAVLQQTKTLVLDGKEPTYFNLLVDEWGEFMDRAHMEFFADNTNASGKVDGRAGFGELLTWVVSMGNLMRELTSYGVGVCCLSHSRDAEAGKMGGLSSPTKSISDKLTKMSDGVIERRYKNSTETDGNGKLKKPRRIWNATGSEETALGLRGLDSDLDIEDMSLKAILESCGFDM